ncbi:MAG: hypothetical protein MJA83_11625 [Gammaproteobacteria bacterium]|nr:hypothetical protein [Gammaproteobacteria bacterium]
MSRLRLPRPIVDHILRQAQHETDRGLTGIVAAENDVPTRCAQLHAGQTVDDVLAENENLFAVYRSRANPSHTPVIDELRDITDRDVLLLTVSLETKGVLQLQGWQPVNDQLERIDIGIREADD